MTLQTLTKSERDTHENVSDLPAEIIYQIIQQCVISTKPIPVSALFEIEKLRSIPEPDYDYRILHTSPEFYRAGIKTYYLENIFSISLHDWYFHPKTMEMWPHGLGRSLAAEFVRHIHLRARKDDESGHGWFKCALKCLRGFKELKSVVFDIRVIGDRPFDTERWFDKKASTRMVEMMGEAGVNFREGNVWVVDRDGDDYERQMPGLEEDVEAGLEALKCDGSLGEMCIGKKNHEANVAAEYEESTGD